MSWTGRVLTTGPPGKLLHIKFYNILKQFYSYHTIQVCLFLLKKQDLLNQQSPTFLAPGTSFEEDNFSMDRSLGDGFRTIQVDYIY